MEFNYSFNHSMKKIIFLTACLTLSAASFFSYGQDLEATKCADGKFGYKDNKTATVVIPCKYDFVGSSFSEGLAVVKIKNKYGCIDKTGKEVIPLKYDFVGPFSNGLAGAVFNGKWGFIDKFDKLVIPFKYNYATSFSEGLAMVELKGKQGFIDKSGTEVIPLRYNNARSFSEGLAQVQLNGKKGHVDVAGAFYEGILNNDIRKTIAAKRTNGEYDAILMQIEQAANSIDSQIWEREELLAMENVEAEQISVGKEEIIEIEDPAEKTEIVEKIEKEKNTDTFSFFAKNYVESKINIWQQKGEFEKTTDWQLRVNENNRKIQANELLKAAEQVYITEHSKGFTVGNMTLGTYDADNEVYLVKNSIYGDWLVSVPISEAQTFKNEWNGLKKTPRYVISNDLLAIAEMIFSSSSGKTYKYDNQASLNYTVANIEYNFAPIDINVPSMPTASAKNQNISKVNLQVGKSDVAVNIPVSNTKNNKAFAVIIANENYRRESQVEFAQNDGETFQKYCIQTLGLPETNVHFSVDATLNDIRGEIDWISSVADAFKGEANIIFYYAGHGIPDESSKSAYLLPVDGYGANVHTGYKLDDFYQTLGKLPAKNITVFMDACFSGAQRSGEMLASARGVAIKSVQGMPVGNMVVFSAAQGDETAYPYKEKGHGMFTYFLLKKLQETKGEATLGDLGDYITNSVRQQSIVVNGKSQTPVVTPATAMGDKWKKMKLK